MAIEGGRGSGCNLSECFQQLTQYAARNRTSEDCDDGGGDSIPCSNNRFGCTFRGKQLEIEEHINICYHRNIRCAWYLQCGKNVIRLSNYKRHLQDVHRIYIKKIGLNQEDEIILKTDSMVRTGNILRIEGSSDYFFRRCLLNLHEDILLICVHYIGKAELARNYVYRLRIHQGFHHAKYTCTSYCLPYVENSSSCVTSPDCTVLFPSKFFLTKDYLREIRYSLTIKRV